MVRASLRLAPLAAAIALAGCAASPEAPIIAVAAPIPTLNLKPAMPQGYAGNFQTPRDASGRYLTPADGIGTAEALWHVRSGLNVAALACRESDMAPAYNAMLARLAAPFAAADGETKRQYQARYGAAWQNQHDNAMTRVYNWYAQPFAHAGFCQAAADALTEAQTLPPAQAADFATRHLANLARPFLDGYRRWDDFRVAEAQWLASMDTPDAALRLDRVAATR